MTKYTTRPDNDRRIEAEAPARQDILNLFEDQGRPLQRREIVERLNVLSDDSREILRRRLKAMVRDGQLVKNRRNAYGLPAMRSIFAGRP